MTLLLLALVFQSCRSRSGDKETSPKGGTDQPITISGQWARPSGGQTPSAAYLTISNNGSMSDTLRAISTGAAGMTEVHESYETEEGLSGMRPAPNLAIPPGEHLEMRPGGFHIMLMQLNRPFNIGDSLVFDLIFARAGTLRVSASVRENN